MVDRIALPILVPPQAKGALSEEQAALFAYLSSVRDAVSGAQSGYEDYAGEE